MVFAGWNVGFERTQKPVVISIRMVETVRGNGHLLQRLERREISEGVNFVYGSCSVESKLRVEIGSDTKAIFERVPGL